MPDQDELDRFVAAVHRRAVGIALVERVGICLATAAGIACLLTLVAEWRGVAIGGLSPVLIGAAVIVGAAWGAIRPPTKLDAIMQADQQLQLADLLSSAMVSSRDGFGQAVRAMAIRACTTRSPSQVILNRLGARAWSGIGLAWAMVLVLSLLAGSGNDSHAGDSANGQIGKPTQSSTDARTSLANGRLTVGGREASSDDFSHLGPPQDSQTAPGEHSATGKPTASANSNGQQSSQTTAAHADHPATPRGEGTNTTTDPRAVTAAGNGASSKTNTSPGRSGDSVTAARPDRAAAPWSSDHWPTDRAAALQAVDAGRVPDAYRDLVRDYFDVAK